MGHPTQPTTMTYWRNLLSGRTERIAASSIVAERGEVPKCSRHARLTVSAASDARPSSQA